jgi:hypothetical protein
VCAQAADLCQHGGQIELEGDISETKIMVGYPFPHATITPPILQNPLCPSPSFPTKGTSMPDITPTDTRTLYGQRAIGSVSAALPISSGRRIDEQAVR